MLLRISFKPTVNEFMELYLLILDVHRYSVVSVFSLQSGRRDEDHEYGEAAQDHPHHSEPNGRPPRFQCESKAKFRTCSCSLECFHVGRICRKSPEIGFLLG